MIDALLIRLKRLLLLKRKNRISRTAKTVRIDHPKKDFVVVVVSFRSSFSLRRKKRTRAFEDKGLRKKAVKNYDSK